MATRFSQIEAVNDAGLHDSPNPFQAKKQMARICDVRDRSFYQSIYGEGSRRMGEGGMWGADEYAIMESRRIRIGLVDRVVWRLRFAMIDEIGSGDLPIILALK